MKTAAAIGAAAWLAAGVAPAQELPDPQVFLFPDSIGSGHDLLWAGEEDVTYFVMGSEDLAAWRYFNVIDQGNEAGHRLWFFRNAPSFFVRVCKTAEPTFPWDDPDEDDLLTSFELEYSMATGLDPFNADSNDDQTEDGAEDPDDDDLTNLIEQRLGLNPAVDDSDADETLDGLEDSDQDGIGNVAELTREGGATDPGNPDTDGDGIPDGIDPNPTSGDFTATAATTLEVWAPLE